MTDTKAMDQIRKVLETAGPADWIGKISEIVRKTGRDIEPDPSVLAAIAAEAQLEYETALRMHTR